MKTLHRLAERIRRGERLSPPAAILLSALTPAVRIGMLRRRWQKRFCVNAQVISFGNITAGGTGKTPAVIERAAQEIAAGKRVAVLTRGYRGGQKSGIVVGEGGKTSFVQADPLGDEPALIARRVPGVLIIKGADRVAAAHKAINEFHCDTLILDDGFQYLRLDRDEDIVLIDATSPFGNRRLIPRGILREPVSSLARATHIVLTRCDQVENLQPLLDELAALCPEIPIRKTRHAPTGLWRVCDGADASLDELAGSDVQAVCAIANPEAFFTTLESLGATLTQCLPYPDHSRFSFGSLLPTLMVVTTEKDAARFRDAPENVYALRIELRDMEPPA